MGSIHVILFSSSAIGEVTEPVKVKRVFAAPEAKPTQDSLPDLSTTVEMFTFTDLSTEIAETETETETEVCLSF